MMTPMKHRTLIALIAATLAVGGCCHAGADIQPADKASAEMKKITGIDQCAACEGITGSDQDVLLVEKDGTSWVLIGSGPGYQAAQDGHNEGKTITATLAGEPVSRIGLNGKPYKEVKVSDIKIIG
jgi:hypothetical protein